MGRLLLVRGEFGSEQPHHLHGRIGCDAAGPFIRNVGLQSHIQHGKCIVAEVFERKRCFGEEQPAALHHWSRSWSDGTFGRIALRASSWLALGGYDEALLGMGWQDIDLLVRARAIGLRYCLTTDGLRPAVQNTLTQKLANVGKRPTSEHEAQTRLRALHLENMVRSFGRPVTLPPEEQCRFQGVVDLHTPAVL